MCVPTYTPTTYETKAKSVTNVAIFICVFIVATKRPAQAFTVSVSSFIMPFFFVVCRLFAPCLIGAGRSGFLF